ncbi:hypothetical protein ACVFBP_004748, partial [Escherichia coli]
KKIKRIRLANEPHTCLPIALRSRRNHPAAFFCLRVGKRTGKRKKRLQCVTERLEPSANLVLVPDYDDCRPSILKRLGFPFSASEATPDPDGRRRKNLPAMTCPPEIGGSYLGVVTIKPLRWCLSFGLSTESGGNSLFKVLFFRSLKILKPF